MQGFVTAHMIKLVSKCKEGDISKYQHSIEEKIMPKVKKGEDHK